jgi:glucokinase
LGADGDAIWAAEFPTGGDPREWARRLRKHADSVTGDSLWGVVLSVPGVVDEAAGRVLYSPNLHWTEGVFLPDQTRGAWPLPVLVVQEIRALALGHLAAHPEAENFLLVDFGEGVGGAVIEGGHLLRHPLPLSAELGHTPVLGNDRPCGCGARGCVETLLSRRGIAGSFGPGDPGPDLAAAIAANGVPAWLQQSLVAMGGIIAGALNALGLRHVVVTGHLTALPPAVIDILATATRRGSMWARFGEVLCEAAPRRRMAGLVAAGLDRLLFPADDGGPLHLAARSRMNETASRPRRNRPGPRSDSVRRPKLRAG